MNYNVKIENLAEIKATLIKFPARMAKNLQDAIKKSVFVLHAEAWKLTPKDTEETANTQTFRIKPLRGEVFPTTKYAPFVHEGHRQEVGRYVPALGKRLVQPFVKGKPWLKWTVDATKNEVNTFFKRAVEKTLEETAK